MAAVAQRALTARTAAAASRSSRVALVPSRVALPARVRIAVKATQQEDPSAKLQEQLQQAVKFTQEKWEQTPGAERPAAVALVIGAVIAQVAIGATVDAVHKIPFVNTFLEFVGLAVLSVYGYRYFTDPAERENVKKSVESFVNAVTGK